VSMPRNVPPGGDMPQGPREGSAGRRGAAVWRPPCTWGFTQCSSKLGDGAGLDTSGGGVDRDRRADPARRAAGAEGITPAYAGSTCSSPPASWPSADHPRIRGEHTDRRFPPETTHGSPPHTRGARLQVLGDVSGARIIPACAGSTTRGTERSGRSSDHPRVRGEHTRYAGDGGSSSGSPPRARGARAHRAHEGAAGGITPACAGSTTRRGWSRTRKSDHPRVRGEHACVVVTATSANGSPPRARGAPGPNRRNKVNLRITPACAGSTRQAVRAGQGRRGSPPRARGAPVAHRLVVPRRRITPACAGSTSSAPRSPRSRWDHPRVRGEHAAAFAATFVALGSPPRARGAHLMTRDYSSPPRKTDSLCAAVQALRLRRVRRHRVLTRQRLPHREPRLFGVVAVLVAVADPAPEVDVAAPVAGLGAAEVPVGGVGGRVVGIQLRLPGVAVDRRAPDPLRGDVDLDPDVAVVQPRARQVPR